MMANSPARTGVDVGSVIADTYTIEGLLGRGGMGAVFLASHRRLAGKRVAIKILHTEIEDADVVARFKREADIAARLNHPNIVGVIDYNVAPDGMPYLVLDYLEGETLAQRLAAGPLTLEHAVSILRQVGSALAAAHRAGIVHRDLKPQNIFLVPTEVAGREVEVAKVLDFGISKIRGSQTVKTQDSTLLGTPQYMAPEQATGQHALVDERTDVFALGAIVYEMLTGQPAFSGASIPEVVFKVVYEQPVPLAQLAPSTPPAVVAAVDKAMTKAAEDRFETVAAFVEAVTGQPLSVTRGQAAAALGLAATDVPSGAKRVTSNEAFDQTMGPGSAPGAIVAGTALGVGTGVPARTAPARAPAAGTAPGAAGTVPGAAPATAPGASLPAVSAPTVGAASPPRRRSAGLIAVVALAGAAVAAGGVYVTMRGDRSDHPRPQHARGDEPVERPAVPPVPPAPPQVAPPIAPSAPVGVTAKPGEPGAAGATGTKPGEAGTKPGETGAAGDTGTKPGEAGTKPGEAGTKPVGEKPTKPVGEKPPAPPRPPPHPAGHPPAVPDDSGPEDADVRDQLKQAASALEHHDYNLAEKLATTVINSPAGPKQRAAARLIHGQVQCLARNDQEAAQIDLRALEGFRALRQRLLTLCRNRGVITAP
jgi:serine/threonine-protein kinase